MKTGILPATLGLLACFSLSACGEDQVSSVDPASLSPADAHLAAIYDRSCKTCHADPDAAAPLTGDTGSWQSRLDKGMDVLLDNVVNGYEGMPPFGLCMDCSVEEFEKLIQFMANGQ